LQKYLHILSYHTILSILYTSNLANSDGAPQSEGRHAKDFRKDTLPAAFIDGIPYIFNCSPCQSPLARSLAKHGWLIQRQIAVSNACAFQRYKLHLTMLQKLTLVRRALDRSLIPQSPLTATLYSNDNSDSFGQNISYGHRAFLIIAGIHLAHDSR